MIAWLFWVGRGESEKGKKNDGRWNGSIEKKEERDITKKKRESHGMLASKCLCAGADGK